MHSTKPVAPALLKTINEIFDKFATLGGASMGMDDAHAAIENFGVTSYLDACAIMQASKYGDYAMKCGWPVSALPLDDPRRRQYIRADG